MATIKCEKCPFTDTKLSRLKKHAKTEHNHVMATVKCEKCPYTATRLYDLRSHVKTVHDKIKDLICEDCGKAFSNKANRSRHRDMHHLQKHVHACDECGAKLNGRRELTRHVYLCRWRKTQM